MDAHEPGSEAEAAQDVSPRGWLARVFPRLGEPLLSETARQLRRVNGVAGEVLIWRGEPADSFYIIARGEVNVKREESSGSGAPLATLGPGQFFGEMSMLTGATRTATVTARTDVELLALDHHDFRRLVERSGQLDEAADRDAAGAAGPGAASGEWRGPWDRAIRSTCGALLAAQDAVGSIELVGSVREREDSLKLLQLTLLARRIATEYGLEVQVRYDPVRPILRLTMDAVT